MFSVRPRKSPSWPSLKYAPADGLSAGAERPGPPLSRPADALSSRPFVTSSRFTIGLPGPDEPPRPRKSTPTSRRKLSETSRKRVSTVTTMPAKARRSFRNFSTWPWISAVCFTTMVPVPCSLIAAPSISHVPAGPTAALIRSMRSVIEPYGFTVSSPSPPKRGFSSSLTWSAGTRSILGGRNSVRPAVRSATEWACITRLRLTNSFLVKTTMLPWIVQSTSATVSLSMLRACSRLTCSTVIGGTFVSPTSTAMRASRRRLTPVWIWRVWRTSLNGRPSTARLTMSS